MGMSTCVNHNEIAQLWLKLHNMKIIIVGKHRFVELSTRLSFRPNKLAILPSTELRLVYIHCRVKILNC
jgi:hypothetical protein